jgi:hypothetical protein
MAVQVVADVRVDARPSLERLELTLWLRHVAIKVVEVAKLLRFEARISIGRIIALVVFNIHENTVLCSRIEESKVVLQCFDGRLSDKDVYLTLDGIESNGIMSGIRSEDRDGVSRRKGINGLFVGLTITGIIGGI